MYHHLRMTDLAWHTFLTSLSNNPSWLDVDTELLYTQEFAPMQRQIQGSLAYINAQGLRIVSVGYDREGNPKTYMLESPSGWKPPILARVDDRVASLRVVL